MGPRGQRRQLVAADRGGQRQSRMGGLVATGERKLGLVCAAVRSCGAGLGSARASDVGSTAGYTSPPGVRWQGPLRAGLAGVSRTERRPSGEQYLSKNF